MILSMKNKMSTNLFEKSQSEINSKSNSILLLNLEPETEKSMNWAKDKTKSEENKSDTFIKSGRSWRDTKLKWVFYA